MDGLLLVDKPADMTSHDVVHHVRKILKQKSVGHTGTLDPLATGLMILVLGEATKLSDYLLSANKSYQLKVRLGMTTDSLDRTGKVLTETPCDLPHDQIQAAALSLQGKFNWPVPMYSAAKVDGKKLYEYARNGEEIVPPVKPMSFWDAAIEEVGSSRIQLSIHCSKGSFVRVWASKLGEMLKVGGVIDELRRLSVGTFTIDRAITLEQLSQGQELGNAFVPMAQALPLWKSLMAGPKEARLMANGQVPRDLSNRLVFEQKQAFEKGEPVFVKVVTGTGELLAILAAEPGQGLKIRRVFRTFP